MHKFILPILVGLTLLDSVGSSNAAENPLEKYQWKNRLLMVVSDSLDAKRAKEVSTSLSAAQCDLEDRDIRVGWVYPDGTGRIGEEVLSRVSVKVLRHQLALSNSSATMMLLVGKDGGVKSRYPEMPELDQVFALIDGMPMRRSEMRSSGKRCP